MEISNDPNGALSILEGVILDYETTMAQSKKDKAVVISQKPSTFYMKHAMDYVDAMSYYNNLLNTQCPKDNLMELSIEIRKYRQSYSAALGKLMLRIDF